MRSLRAACASSGRAVLLLLLTWFVACTAAHAAVAANDPAQLEAVSLFEDRSTTMSVDDVAARLATLSRESAAAARPSFNVEFSRSAWWVRATLVNRDSVPRALVLALRDARVDRADFYIDRDGTWTLASRFPD